MARATIPNVYMYWCQRRAKCRWCEKDVEAGTPVVQVWYWNKGNPDLRTRNVRHYYHPQCWVSQGLDKLEMNPYVPYQRKKPNLTLTPKQKEFRLKLLRRKSSIDQRRKNLKSEYPDRLLDEARLNEQVSNIMVEIAKVGGIPKKWLD